MSAEFVSEYNEPAIFAAVEYMEDNMRSFEYIGKYIQDLQDVYSKYPDGDIEIMRMIRAAQLITNRTAGDMGGEVQAVYHGELLGLELINNLDSHADNFFKTGYAQSFMKFNLEKDRPSGTEAVGVGIRERLQRLSESLQIDLSFPIQQHDLNQIYEEFGRNATSKLYDETQHQDLAMIGFRMIVIQALKPAGTNETYELLDRIPAPIVLASSPPLSIADLARNYERSINKVDEIFGEQESANFMNWENISNIQEILYQKFIELTAPEDEPAFSDDSTLAEIDRYIEGVLMKFIESHRLIGDDDLLSVEGKFYCIASDENGVSLYENPIEIQGKFDSIRIVDVPSNQQLLKDLAEGVKNQGEEGEGFVGALAIRIVDPVFIVVTTDGERIIDPSEGETIDIPLNYENVTIKRIEAKELEIEA